MREINKADIVGARIVDIHITREPPDGLLWDVYFTVDRGFTFTLPFAGYQWSAVELPRHAGRLAWPSLADMWNCLRFPQMHLEWNPSIVWQIWRRPIMGVYCGPYEEDFGYHSPQDGTIVFKDGAQLSYGVSPFSSSQLFLCLPKSGRCQPLDQMTDYFTIPLYTPVWWFKRLFADLTVGVPDYQSLVEFTESWRTPGDTRKDYTCNAIFLQSEAQFSAFVARLNLPEPGVISVTGVSVTALSKRDPERPWRLLVRAEITNAPEKKYRVHIDGQQLDERA